MKTMLFLPLMGLAVSGLWLRPNTSVTAPTLPSPSDPGLPVKATIWTPSTVVHKDELLTLHFQTPNAPYLGVKTPDGKFFYVVFPHETAVGKLRPLVESTEFKNMQKLCIRLNTFKADPYTYGIYENQPVFTKSGTYRFLLGDNLHTDDPASVASVSIEYRHYDSQMGSK